MSVGQEIIVGLEALKEDVRFLNEIYALSASGPDSRDDLVHKILDHTDRLLCDGQFARLNTLLSIPDVDRLSTSGIAAFLSPTRCASKHLPSRLPMLERIVKSIGERGERLVAKYL